MAFARLAVPLLLASVAGCASDKDRVEKQLSKLRDEVAHLQSETDRMGERLDAMEGRQAAVPHYAEERVSASSQTMTRPKLKIVRVEPGGDGAPAEAEQAESPAPDADTGPRVLIQGEGKLLESRTMSGTGSAPAPVAAKSAKPDAAKSAKADAAKPAKADSAKPAKTETSKAAKPDATPAN